MALYCRKHAEVGMVSTKFALCARKGCSNLRFSGAKGTPYCSHHAEASVNISSIKSSLEEGRKKGSACASPSGPASELRPAEQIHRKRPISTSDGRERGDADGDLMKRVRSGEGNVLMSPGAASSNVPQFTEEETRWGDVKVETCFSTE